MPETNDYQYISELISAIEKFYNSIMSIERFQIGVDENEPNMKMQFKIDEELIEFSTALKTKIKDVELHEKYKDNTKVLFYYTNLIRKAEDGKIIIESKNVIVKNAIHKHNLFLKKIENVKKQNLNFALMNIVSSFEVLISKLLEYNLLYVYKKTSILNSKTIKYENLVDMNSIDEIRRKMVEEYIDDCMYKKFDEWIELVLEICLFGKKTKKEIQKDPILQDWIGKISEMYQRRNIIAHNNGIVNNLYFTKTKREYIHPKAEFGKELETTKEYLSEMCKAVSLFGFYVISQNITSKKLFKNPFFFENLEDLCLDMLKTSKYDMAKMLYKARLKHLEGNKIEVEHDITTDFLERYNYWLCCKLAGEGKDIEGEVNDYMEDNSYLYTIDRFFQIKLGLSSLLDSNDKFAEVALEYLGKVKKEEVLVNMLEWPMFKIIRNEEKFIEFKEQVYYDKNI